MILTYKATAAIQSQIDLQRGQAIINGVDAQTAGEIGFEVDLRYAYDGTPSIKVEVSGGKDFIVTRNGEVAY